MVDLPRISVVIPCFNAARYVVHAVRSVQQQEWPEIEIIVVDDGSKDESPDVVATQCPGTRLIRQPNAGVAAARNTGIQAATGEWVAFLDADDLWLPGKLLAQWRHVQRSPGVKLVYSAWIVWESSDLLPDQEWLARMLSDSDPDKWAGPSGWIYPELLLDCEVWTSTVLARRDLLTELGGFDEALRIGEDYDLWLRASRQTEILRLDQPTSLYRIHASNTTRSAPNRNFQAEVVERAISRWGFQSPDGRCADESLVKRSLARTWRNFAGAHLGGGNLAQARGGALQAVRMAPTELAGWKLLASTLLSLRGPTPRG